MTEIARELRDIADARPIAGEEFASLMRNRTMGLAGRYETLGDLEESAIELVNLGHPDDYFATYAARVRRLDEKDLAQAAQAFIRPRDVVWVVIGDVAKIESGVRELGFGEIVRLDSDGRPFRASP
jgi:zinc protease